MREKILRSLNSSDLSDEEWENAAHIVASLGMAQVSVVDPGPKGRLVNRKHLSIGALLLHIRAGQAMFVSRALALITLHVAYMARRSSWKGIGRHNAYLLAQLALDRFLNALCEPCNGVGKIGEFGQVIIICQTCKGSGKRRDDDLAMADELGMSLHQFRACEIPERIKDVVSMLDRMEGYAAGGTKQQARGDSDH